MKYKVGANITGERQEIQQRDGQTIFQSRGEAEAFRDELRRGGFDRIDIFEVSDEGRPSGAITAPASTPDRFGIGHQPSTEAQQAAREAAQRGIPVSQLEVAKRLENLDRAIAERPQIAGIRESLQQQIRQQAAGDFGARTLNLTPSERLQQEAQSSQAQRIATEAARGTTAAELVMGFRKLPESYQTSQSLRGIAEASIQRRELLKQAVGGSFAETRGGERRDELFLVPAQSLNKQGGLVGEMYINQQVIGNWLGLAIVAFGVT